MLRPLILACLLCPTWAAAQTATSFESLPKIDVHAHYLDDMPAFAAMLQRINMRAVNICVFKDRPALLPVLLDRAASLHKQYAPQMEFVATFDLSQVGKTGFHESVFNSLDRSFARGAVAVKIWKEAGMQKKLPDGTFLMPDSGHLDPIYAYLSDRGIPLMAHFGDPIEAWQPLDEHNVHFRYFSNNPEWYMHGRDDFPSHAEIMAAFDSMLEKHPNLVVIGAHLGSLEHDLDALGKRFDRFPNFHVDVAARTPDLKRYPVETIRTFFIKYQDRILYGLDQGRFDPGTPPSAEEQTRYGESMENAYRRDYQFYSGEALNLPQEVLEKFYARNTIRVLKIASNAE